MQDGVCGAVRGYCTLRFPASGSGGVGTEKKTECPSGSLSVTTLSGLGHVRTEISVPSHALNVVV